MADDNYWTKRVAGRSSRRLFLRNAGIAGAGVAGLAVFGCSSNNNKTGATQAPAASASSAATRAGGTPPPPPSAPAGAATKAGSPAAASAATGAAHAKPAGMINISVATLMEQSTNPFFQTGGLSTPIFIHAYEGFYRTGEAGVAVPALATMMEQPDPQTIIFTLRQGTKYWDGSPVTIDDIKWSYDQFVNQTNPPAPSAVLLKKGVASIDTPDTSHVTIKFTSPVPFNMEEFGSYTARGWPVASQAYFNKVGADTFKVTPMCTGPFQITKNQVGQFVELQANENYWDPARIPYVKTVRLNIVPDQQTRLAQIRNGEADIIEGIIGAAAEGLKSESSVKIVNTPNTAQLTVRFLDAAPPDPSVAPNSVQKDIRFRQALVTSVDEDQIAKSLLKLGTPSPNLLIFPNSTGYDASLYKPPTKDVNNAKMLLKQSGYDGSEISLYSYVSSSYPLIPDVVQAYAGFWKDIGLNTKIEQQESGSYFAKFTAHSLRGLGAISFPNFSNGALLLVTYYATGGAYSTTHNLPDLEKIINQLKSEFDPNKQLDLMKQAFKLAYDQYYFIPCPYVDSLWATGKKIKDWKRIAGVPYVNGLETVQLNG